MTKTQFEEALRDDQFDPDIDSVEVPAVLHEAEEEGDLLKWDTINTAYISAIAAIYKRQVSLGQNLHPPFRGAGFNNTMKAKRLEADELAREQFEDRGANGANSTYTDEDFLRINQALLKGSGARPSVSYFDFLLSTLLELLFLSELYSQVTKNFLISQRPSV